MSPKDEIAKSVDKLFKFLGIDPFIGILFIFLLLSAYAAKDIKNWKKINTFQKNMDISIWSGLLILIFVLIVRLIRGY